MAIHSRLLVHWTGKDIEEYASTEQPQKYVERLRDDLKNGLYTKITSEDAIRKWKVKNLVRICFTEVRLSQAQTHARRYGRLGIGFTRDFVMDRGGRPAIYVPYAPKDDGRLLEDSIRTAYEKSQGEVQKSAKWILAHVKRMSDGRDEDYYEEMEWRLVWDGQSAHFKKDAAEGVYRLQLEASDIKLIVLPDENTKRLSLGDDVIKEYFSKHLPMVTTLEDCANF